MLVQESTKKGTLHLPKKPAAKEKIDALQKRFSFKRGQHPQQEEPSKERKP